MKAVEQKLLLQHTYPKLVAEIRKLANKLGVTCDYLCGRTDHEKMLPPDGYIVDMEKLARLRNHAEQPGDETWATPVPTYYVLVNSTEHALMEQELETARGEG